MFFFGVVIGIVYGLGKYVVGVLGECSDVEGVMDLMYCVECIDDEDCGD